MGASDAGVLQLAPGEPARLVELDELSGFVTGWAFPDDSGMWTWGSRSDLSIAFPPVDDDADCRVVFLIDSVCVARDDSLRADLAVNGASVASREFSGSDAPFAWRVELPRQVWAAGQADVTITVSEPRTPMAIGWVSDNRPLGLHLHSLTVEMPDRSVQRGQPVEFIAGSDGERLLAEGWFHPEPTGIWTDGDRARLVLDLGPEPMNEPDVVLDVAPFVTPEHPQLTVDVWSGDAQLARRVFRHDDVDNRLVLRLPPSDGGRSSRTVLDLHLDAPARPFDVRVNEDTRRLGLHLRTLTLEDASQPTPSRQRAGPADWLRRAWRHASHPLRR